MTMRLCPGTRADTLPAVQMTKPYRVSSPCRSATLRRSASTASRASLGTWGWVGTEPGREDVTSVPFCGRGFGWHCDQLAFACLQPVHDVGATAAEVVVQLGVVGEELVVGLHVCGDGLVDGLVGSPHGTGRGMDVGVGASSDGGVDRRAQRRALLGHDGRQRRW